MKFLEAFIVLPSKQILTKLVGSVYDAAANPTLWEPFLSALAKTCRADSAALVMHDFGLGIHTVSASWHLNPYGDSLYKEHYGSVDVWSMRARSKPVGRAFTSGQLCPFEELVRTEFYNDFLFRYGVVHGMFGLVERDVTSWASVSLYRGPLSCEFRDSDLDTLSLLVPHIQRAFKLHFQFSELKEHADGIESALNMLATGVVFLGHKNSVLFMNTGAEELLNRKDGLLLTQGKLNAAVYSESASLRAMIGETVGTGTGKGLSAGGTILISRKKGRPLSVTVAPLREFGIDSPRRPVAVLFISDPDRNPELPTDMLKRCYGLTPAEARLTLVLLEGHSLKAAADSCGVTHNTAKSQLKSTFLKTQVQRQGELIRLLLSNADIVREP